ncbi:MAG: hypothetical protein ABJR05_13845 [Balneola sp.]
MKSFNIIDKSLLGGLLLTAALFFAVPAETATARSMNDCQDLCTDLCGTPTIEACQYTFCPGSQGPTGTMCYGEFQEDPGEGG